MDISHHGGQAYFGEDHHDSEEGTMVKPSATSVISQDSDHSQEVAPFTKTANLPS